MKVHRFHQVRLGRQTMVKSPAFAVILAILGIWVLVPSIQAQEAATEQGQAAGGVAAGAESNDESRSDESTSEVRGSDSRRPAHLVRVPLPINSASVANVRQTLERLIDKAPSVIRPEDRAAIVLEFDTSNGQTGQGSKLESCLELARFLISSDLSKVKTIAYIPGPRRSVLDDLGGVEIGSKLQGHAVLVAIAANEMAMHPDASIGKAGVDEPSNDQIVIDTYRNVARSRLAIPVPVVMSMIDKDVKLYRVSTNNGFVYVDEQELNRLEAAGESIAATTISEAGQSAEYTSEQLFEYRLVRKQVKSRNELALAIDAAPNSLEGDPTMGENWDAVQLTLPDYIDGETVNWVLRALNVRSPNLIIFRLNSSGGDPESCYRLASYVAEFDSNKVRTVAFVGGVARGPAALFALSCDHLIMTPAAELGGKMEPEVDEEWLVDSRGNIHEIAQSKGRDWSIYQAVVDLDLGVSRFRERNSGQIRLLSNEEFETLEDPASWVLLGPIDVREGIDANQAEQLFLARTILNDMNSVETFYQLEEEPVELTPTFTDQWLDRVARFLSSPMVAPWLLFAAVFLLSTEMSAPGIGVPGFLGTVCLVAFFWSQYLDGNAHWLEILLFLLGIVFLAMEVFLLPGIGIFGIGGLLMVVVSIVLASQSFVIPRNSEQLNRLPVSLSMVLAGFMGFFVAIAVLKKLIPNTPYLKRMMLEPPGTKDKTGLKEDKDSDAIVDWSYLLGRRGETVTRLFPSGKAKFDGRVYDVISDGRMIDKGAGR